ncbi:MAG: UDP-3-O-acyl-N-acetylglucosamine deacetylase [Verrucomicrobia subdivision 3 bacterium]|nr:UDP-3-O-acyl-N-acetylglucosamine deacetylase [Limisphaerales bacterium]MCS1414938.1 UDP-3-O-acyl-N-acetylglucosamine deacetylase [Limisphaerales bacterium]
MTFLPAPPNSGIRFRRIDLEGKPEIDALVDNVSDTTRSTTLSKGNIKLHTVEHILATFHGFGIDNVIVELNANEPPITDGSAHEYCRMIKTSGTTLQPEDKDPLVVTAPISITSEESILSIFPCDRFKVSCTSSDDKGRFTQFYSSDITPESWERELSRARTFCFFDEIEFLIKNGLIKGGSLENAVIIRDDVVLTNEPLRYQEEFVRHKILDIIGDLSLVGRPIQGHVVAVRPSHRANCELARELDRQVKKRLARTQTFLPPRNGTLKKAAQASAPEIPAGGEVINIDQIMKILPHRYPFLMIDKVIKIAETAITCLKNVTLNEPYFQGHFPGHPIMPGVLQLEAMAQAGGLLILNKAENWGKIAYLISAENVKWRKPVQPGDVLIIDIELIKERGKTGKAKGRCKVGNDIVSEGVVMFMLTDA